MVASKQLLPKIYLFLMCCACVSSDRPKREEGNSIPDLCQDPSIDAATTTGDGSTYIFKGDYYWEMKWVMSVFIPKDYPRKITQDWSGLPGNLDAAITFPDGITLFFKENKYWSFRNKKRHPGYPKDISDWLEGIPDCIDAAVLWSVDGKAYFFKGSQYWLYPGEGNSPNPRPISSLDGMPSDIDAAFAFANLTYFFKGRGYYRADERKAAVSTHDPRLPYPRSNALWWFGCQNTGDQNGIDLTSHKRSYQNPACMDRVSTNSSSTRMPTDKDYMDGSGRLTTGQQQNDRSDRTTPTPANGTQDVNSSTLSYASLLLTWLLVAVLHSHTS